MTTTSEIELPLITETLHKKEEEATGVTATDATGDTATDESWDTAAEAAEDVATDATGGLATEAPGELSPEAETGWKDEEATAATATEATTGWDGPHDAENPLNWNSRRKWTNVFLISAQAMLSPIASTMLAVASQSLVDEFHLTNIYLPALPVGTYVLGLGLGPLYLAPWSEIQGRRIVYLTSFSVFTVLNVGCALAPNITALSILRFFAGTCGSAGPTLGGASIGDMFTPRERGKAQAIYSIGPTAGPAVGPLIGAFIVSRTHGWRWLLWVIAIASGVTVILSGVLLKETYGPFILQKKAQKARNAGDGNNHVHPSEHISVRSRFTGTFRRPFELLLFSPICTFLSLYMALIYGILYLHLVTIPLLYGPAPVYGLFSYRWTNGVTGLAYLGSAAGTVVGIIICATCLNRSYAFMQRRYYRKTGSEQAQPESRMPFLQIGMTIVPIGLTIFAWTAEKQTHWIFPLIGAGVFSVGMLMAYIAIQTYIVDTYEAYSASALAAVILARCTTSCVFSVTGFQLFKAMGYAWGTMVIAFVCVAMLPIPTLLYKYGPYLRGNIPK